MNLYKGNANTLRDELNSLKIKPNTKVVEYEVNENKTCSLLTTFSTVSGLVQYLNNQPLNPVFCKYEKAIASHKVLTSPSKFNACLTWDEAVNKLMYGDELNVEKLNAAIKLQTVPEPAQKDRMVFDVAGFNACVPRYLQGIPAAMYNKKKVETKRKVVTLNKCIDYNAGQSATEIYEWSARTVRIIQAIERMGYKVNLNVLDACYFDMYCKYPIEFVQYRVKNANEPLNIRKLAFMLTNPDMLRRISFRYYEVCDTYKVNGLYSKNNLTYGMCVDEKIYKALFNNNALNEIYLPRIVEEDDLKNIQKLLS